MSLIQSLRHATTAIRVGMLAPGARVLQKSRLFLVNTATTSVVYTVGDICQQKLEGRESLDWARTSRMALLGFMFGPLNHFWYMFLDRRLPGRRVQTVLMKLVIDQLTMAPVCCSVFFVGMGILERSPLEEVKEELKAKFWPTYKMDCMIWPAAQVVNFFWVPPKLRVGYVNLVTLCWTVFLSYMKHKEYRTATAAMVEDQSECANSLRDEL